MRCKGTVVAPVCCQLCYHVVHLCIGVYPIPGCAATCLADVVYDALSVKAARVAQARLGAASGSWILNRAGHNCQA